MTMKLWLVSRTDEADYDEYHGFVCAAPDEISVRLMAARFFLPPETLVTELIGTAAPALKEPKIIMTSFNAG